MSNPVICVFLGRCQWFLCKRSLMKLIQCHAWTAGYHTPSCPTNPFNLSLSLSLWELWTCFSGSSFPFLAAALRERFKVNLVGKSCTESLYASTMLSPLFYLILLLRYYPYQEHTHHARIHTCTHLHKKDRKKEKQAYKSICHPFVYIKGSAALQLLMNTRTVLFY